jgi:hypothetical protein
MEEIYWAVVTRQKATRPGFGTHIVERTEHDTPAEAEEIARRVTHLHDQVWIEEVRTTRRTVQVVKDE